MPLNAQQIHKQDKMIAHIPSAAMAAWAVTIFVGVNYTSNTEDELPMKLTKTICSVLINYCLVHVLSLDSVTDAIDTIRIPEKRKDITVGSVIEMTINTAGSAVASAIYADLNTSLKIPAIATPAGWWSYIVVNTPFHYQGMKNLLGQIKRGGFNAIADVGILTPGLSKYFSRKKLDDQIEQSIERALHDACLAHEVAFSHSGPHQLPNIDARNDTYTKANTLLESADMSHLTKSKALAITKGISSSVLFTSILVALVPFFVDSFDSSAFGMTKFIGTLAANFGLVVLMTKDYTEVIAEAVVYGRVPPLVRRNNKNDFTKRLTIAGVIAVATTAATVFTVFTTLALFDETISNAFISKSSKIIALGMIWFGTIAFNTYAINSLAFQVANKALLKDDPLLEFRDKSEALQRDLVSKPFADPKALATNMSRVFTNEQLQYLHQERRLDGNRLSSEGIDIHESMRQQAKANVLFGFLKGIIPLAGAMVAVYMMQSKLTPTTNSQFGYAALTYAPFILMHALLSNIKQCRQQHTVQRRYPRTDIERGHEALLHTDHAAMNSSRREHSGTTCEQLPSALNALFKICKPALIGFTIDALIRVIQRNVELPMSDQAVSLTASGTGLAAALVSSMS